MKSKELKPCPFCGSAAEQYVYHSAGDTRYQTKCSGDVHTEGCTGTNTASKATQELADKHWNRRV